MSLVWITGVPGAGKSTVCEALRVRGHHALDADEGGFSHWAHRLTGEAVHDSPDPTPAGWLDEHVWVIDAHRVQQLASSSRPHVTFLCGSVENEAEVWQWFDVVVCLIADDRTISRRLAERTTSDFGKHPDELAAVLAWNPTEAERYAGLGATLVDATRPLDEVVAGVLGAAGIP